MTAPTEDTPTPDLRKEYTDKVSKDFSVAGDHLIDPVAHKQDDTNVNSQTRKSMNTSKSLEQLLVQLVEDCHGIVHEQFMGQIDKNPAFDKTAAAIVEAVEGLVDKLTYPGEVNADASARRHPNGIIDPLEFKKAIKEWQG